MTRKRRAGGPATDGGAPDGPADSLRDYLGMLETAGELNRIDTGVSWNLEASAITMLANDRDDRVPVFESVTDAQVPARLVGDPYRGSRGRPWDRPARALGLPRTSRARSTTGR